MGRAFGKMFVASFISPGRATFWLPNEEELKMRKRLNYSWLILVAVSLLTVTTPCAAQNNVLQNKNVERSAASVLATSRAYVDTLTSPYFWGRGYTKDGMAKAAIFLQNEFKQIGLSSFGQSNYLQRFSYPVNIFPNKLEVKINGDKLKPGVDFIVAAESRTAKGKFDLQQADSNVYMNRQSMVVVKTVNKLTWSVAGEVADYTLIEVLKTSLKKSPKEIKIELEQDLNSDFKVNNVLGYVKGQQYPDSFLIISAHYDHLGGMGSELYFPGANDNASGIALLLNLAKYYAENPQPYSIGFICFAGEEAGLKGSDYYTNHPLFPLANIKFLLNTDLAGTGDEGITVVNASEFPAAFALLNAVNDENKFVAKVNARGKAANSDHYHFSEKGVPAFFFYTLGGIRAYHDVYDKAATLPLTEQPDLFKLVIGFYEKIMQK